MGDKVNSVVKRGKSVSSSVGLTLLFNLLSFYLTAAVYVVTSNNLIGCMMLFFWLMQVIKHKGYQTIPVLMVLNDNLTMPIIGGGLVKYLILLMLVMYFIELKKVCIEISHMIQLVVIIIFLILVLFPLKGIAVFLHIPVITYFCIMWRQLERDRIKIMRFCQCFIWAMILSMAVGLIQGRIHTEQAMIGAGSMTLSRFFATFVDPNYAGMFFNAAILMCQLQRPFRKPVLLALVAVLYVGLLMTASMTAIICNIAGIVIFMGVKYGIRWKTVLWCVGGVLVLLGIYLYGLQSEIQVLNSICTRIQLKLDALFMQNDLQSFTSGRTGLLELHKEYLRQAPVSTWFFGGVPATALYVSPLLGRAVAHFEYLDIILNVGIVGALLYYGAVVYRMIRKYKQFRSDHCDIKLLLLLLQTNFLLSGLAINLFLEPQFFLWIGL